MAGNGRCSAKIARNASPAIAQRSGVFSARRPSRSSASTTITVTQDFTPRNAAASSGVVPQAA